MSDLNIGPPASAAAKPVEAPVEAPLSLPADRNEDDSAPIRGAAPASETKVREWEHRDAGFMDSGWFSRVRVLPAGEARAAHSEDVPFETPAHDWQRGTP